MSTVDSGSSFVKAIDLWGRAVAAANWSLDHWYLWPAALVLAVLAFWFRGEHALIGRLDERADAAFGDVDALLSERGALVGNLVSVVRAFAAQERETIRDVLDARIDALEAMGSGAGMRIDSQFANTLQNLFSVSEKYSALASEAHYARLRDDLVRIEDRITAARRFYNLAVEELNGVRRAFPWGFFTGGAASAREKFSLGERRAAYAEPVEIRL